jgi:hypothetical protein
MSAISTEQPPIKCFLSYSRNDDEMLGFVDNFKRDLEGLCFGDRGRRVQVFIDRESIGWGQDWRQQINASIEGALVFMPLVTRTYFDRSYCREEILAFYSAAKNLGVTDLLLPVLVLGQGYITEDSDDIAARVIAQRQYFDFRDAAIEGTTSATWRRAMLTVANKLVDAIELAESSLDQEIGPPASAMVTGADASRFDDDDPGLLDYVQAFGAAAQRMTAVGQEMYDAMVEWKLVLDSATARINSAPEDSRQAILLSLAPEMKDVSARIGNIGREWENSAVEADSAIRALYSLVREFGTPEMKDEFAGQLKVMAGSMNELDAVEHSISELLTRMMPVEVLNSAMRNSIRPARIGITSIRTALEIVRGWADMAG